MWLKLRFRENQYEMNTNLKHKCQSLLWIFTEFWHLSGILHQTTCPYHHNTQQNGVVERKNRYILEVAISLLIDCNVPSHLWGEAVRSAVYLINWTPSSVLNFRKPLDVLSDHCILPSMVCLPPHIFECVIYVHLHPHQRTKLEEQTLKCVFVGYGSTKKDYCAYHSPSKKFYISMDVTFNKHIFFYVDSTLQGGKESEVHNHDVSMFDITDIKLYCKDKWSCEPILNKETSPWDNTVSSDPNQLVQSSP